MSYHYEYYYEEPEPMIEISAPSEVIRLLLEKYKEDWECDDFNSWYESLEEALEKHDRVHHPHLFPEPHEPPNPTNEDDWF